MWKHGRDLQVQDAPNPSRRACRLMSSVFSRVCGAGVWRPQHRQAPERRANRNSSRACSRTKPPRPDLGMRAPAVTEMVGVAPRRAGLPGSPRHRRHVQRSRRAPLPRGAYDGEVSVYREEREPRHKVGEGGRARTGGQTRRTGCPEILDAGRGIVKEDARSPATESISACNSVRPSRRGRSCESRWVAEPVDAADLKSASPKGL